MQQKANDENKIIKVDPSKLVNYKDEKDSIAEKNNIGNNYKIPNNLPESKSNFYSNHSINNIGNTTQRYTVNNNKYFKRIYFPKKKN